MIERVTSHARAQFGRNVCGKHGTRPDDQEQKDNAAEHTLKL
jgi:hypothetical protein